MLDSTMASTIDTAGDGIINPVIGAVIKDNYGLRFFGFEIHGPQL
jgi:hypothetical protein